MHSSLLLGEASAPRRFPSAPHRSRPACVGAPPSVHLGARRKLAAKTARSNNHIARHLALLNDFWLADNICRAKRHFGKSGAKTTRALLFVYAWTTYASTQSLKPLHDVPHTPRSRRW